MACRGNNETLERNIKSEDCRAEPIEDLETRSTLDCFLRRMRIYNTRKLERNFYETDKTSATATDEEDYCYRGFVPNYKKKFNGD